MLDLAFKVHGDYVDFWKFFVPATIALVGWVFSRKAAWPLGQRMAITLVFLGFVVMNFIALFRSQAFLATLLEELRVAGPSGGMTQVALDAARARLSLTDFWWLAFVFHVVVDVVVLYFILWRAGKEPRSA